MQHIFQRQILQRPIKFQRVNRSYPIASSGTLYFQKRNFPLKIFLIQETIFWHFWSSESRNLTRKSKKINETEQIKYIQGLEHTTIL